MMQRDTENETSPQAEAFEMVLPDPRRTARTWAYLCRLSERRSQSALSLLELLIESIAPSHP